MKKDKEWLVKELNDLKVTYPLPERNLYQEGVHKTVDYTLRLLNKLDEPELPVIPQFVADFIKGRTVSECFYYSFIMPNECNQETYEWINDNQTETARAILDGYTIEPEPIKTRQVLVKFFDSQEYRTELTEDSARELIEFLEAN